jgi:gliding motility-associated-like protein
LLKIFHYIGRLTRSRLSKIVVTGLFLGMSNVAFGFHIIGGEVTYECLGFSTPDSTALNFRFEMRVYRDCSGMGANFDDRAEFGVYSEINGVYRFVRVFLTNLLQVNLVPTPDNPCLIIPDNVCVQEGLYQFTLSNLPVIDGSYHVFWRRCCRNQTIDNIVDPRNEGATYTVEITAAAQRVCNNSPRFINFPPTVICVDQPLEFDHSATDAEGDQLVYEFCAPLQGGGPAGGSPNSGDERACNGIRPDPEFCPPPFPPVVFIGPAYTPSNPLGGNPLVSIDANTGIVTGTPRVLGQFVVGVCVKEYRNGELLSVLRRDFQFNVAFCEIAVFADVVSDTSLSGQRFVINSCGENTITFENLSELQSNIQSYLWEFDLGNEVLTATTRDATFTFPGVGLFTGTMIVNEGLFCADTADISVNIYPAINSDFEFDYDTCFGNPVVFVDRSFSGSGEITNWDWDFGVPGGVSQIPSPNYLYPIPGNHEVTLRVEDINRCIAEETKTIPYFPVPLFLVVEPSTFNGCNPATILFNNLSVPIDSTYDIIWDFGDGHQSFEISPAHVYENPGTYSVSLDVTSPIGCNVISDFDDWIRIKDSPEAGFSYSPEKPTLFNPTVSFFDQSVDANAWQWTLGEDAISFIQSPTHTFQDSGLKFVQQVVFNENGCTDTAVAIIDIFPEVTYYLPNAFTPNNDARNDLYMGAGVTDGITDFEMKIWSRWGELVFETDDPSVGWNGQMRNTGQDMSLGVYVCKVRYIDPRGKVVELEEFATLIR